MDFASWTENPASLEASNQIYILASLQDIWTRQLYFIKLIEDSIPAWQCLSPMKATPLGQLADDGYEHLKCSTPAPDLLSVGTEGTHWRAVYGETHHVFME